MAARPASARLVAVATAARTASYTTRGDTTKYIISGLVVHDRKWPLMRGTRLGSNYQEYLQKGRTFSFSLPDDGELASLTT